VDDLPEGAMKKITAVVAAGFLIPSASYAAAGKSG
jgi:hypothetical protein